MVKCLNCRNSDWYELTDLGRAAQCTRCRWPLWPMEWDSFVNFQAPTSIWPNPEFYYRPNEMAHQFWSQCVWASVLGAHYYTGDIEYPTFLLEQKISQPGTDLELQVDWMCVDEGDIILGEAKTANQLHGQDQQQIDKYCRLATEIGAHVAYLTTCPEWSCGTRDRLQDAKEQLAEHELRFDILDGRDVMCEQVLEWPATPD